MRDGIRTRNIAVDHPDQPDRFALLFELFVDACVIAAKGTDTDDRYIDDVVRTQRLSLRLVAAERDCICERNPRLSGFLRGTHDYKRVFFRMAICPA